MPGKKKKYNARFPPARIKKIMQSDEEVGKVAAAVPVIISRALELFVENMLKKANEVTSRRGARTLTPGHLKFCINSESRFDFLKELVSGVPDLQGDMDVNIDTVPTGTTVGEQLSPSETTPSPLTTSSLTWPSEYSGDASNTLPSDISATSAVATSSSQASSVAISTSSISQQFPKSSFKNSTNKNNNTSSSRSSRSSQNDTNNKSLETTNSLEPKESLNTKVVRKRGRPRKSSSDVPSSNKPKKHKTSAQENNKHRDREIIPGVHATQYSLSYNSLSGITLKNPDVKATKPTKSLLEAALVKPSSISERSAAERLRQISRTYSTGSIPSSNSSPISSPNSAVPSFTLTFPIIPQNSESSKNKTGKLKNNSKFSSSQTEIQRPKLKNNSKEGTPDICGQPAVSKKGHTTSNNGFPFTISNILEKEHNSNKQTVTTVKQPKQDTNKIITTPECTPVCEQKHDNGQNQALNVNAVQNVSDNKNSSNASEKTTFPTVSWTMNVVAPKINTSEDIDEDYDA